MEYCEVCERIDWIKKGKNPYFVKELNTGYVVIGDHQRIKGYSLFLCKEHATELHFMESNFRDEFLHEMAIVAEAVYNAFKPDKLNYELLGAGSGVHMHWHIFPRRKGDTETGGPVWKLGPELVADEFLPTPEELEDLKTRLRIELDKLLKKENKQKINPVEITDESVLKLFSEHDDYMIDFLGDDKWCYTRYSENENIEKVWVVSSENLPIGCIAYRKKADGVGEMKRLYIKEEYRGKGISKELLKTLESYAKEQGCHTLFLDTRITLEPAVSLYRSFGFSIVFQQGLYIQMEKKIIH